MSIKIIGHPSLASDLYVKMSQVANPTDRYAVAVCKAGDEIVGHLPRNIATTCSDRTRAWSAIRNFNPRPYDKKEKNRWKTFAIGG